MTLNVEMEYEKKLDFDYEALAKKVTELRWTMKNVPMRQKST